MLKLYVGVAYSYFSFDKKYHSRQFIIRMLHFLLVTVSSLEKYCGMEVFIFFCNRQVPVSGKCGRGNPEWVGVWTTVFDS